MNNATQLEVMSYLDNELSAQEARRVAALITNDPEARAIYNELKETRELLQGNELPLTLKEPHDFYWSQIQRRIASQEATAPARSSALPWWMRLLAPIAGAVALAAVLLSLQGPHIQPLKTTRVSSAMHEIENSPEMATITFRSESEGVTVVWVSARDTTTEPAEVME
ncbi:MAG: anti-sigma factor family protein [Verrucomicrobiota bacterium]